MLPPSFPTTVHRVAVWPTGSRRSVAAVLFALLITLLPAAEGQSTDGERDKAIRSAEQALQSGKLQNAKLIVTLALVNHPGDFALLQIKGHVESLSGDKLLQSDQKRAKAAYRAGAEAFEEAQQAVGERRLANRSYHTWGYCLYRSDDFAAAVKKLEFAFDKSPQDLNRHVVRARCYRALGQLDPAIGDLTAALEYSPHHEGLLLERAELRREKKQGALAAAELKAAVDKLPPPYGDVHTRLLRWIFEYHLGQNDVVRALEPLERIRRERSDLGWLRLELGLLYYRTGLFDKTLVEFQPLVDRTLTVKNYGLGRVYTRLGLIHQHNSELVAAEDDFRRALELSPNEATALRGLISCLRRAGKKAESRALVDRLHKAVRLEEDIRRVSRQISRSPRERGPRETKIVALLELERWEEAGDEIQSYGRTFSDGSEKRLERELEKRRQAAERSP